MVRSSRAFWLLVAGLGACDLAHHEEPTTYEVFDLKLSPVDTDGGLSPGGDVLYELNYRGPSVASLTLAAVLVHEPTGAAEWKQFGDMGDRPTTFSLKARWMVQTELCEHLRQFWLYLKVDLNL